MKRGLTTILICMLVLCGLVETGCDRTPQLEVSASSYDFGAGSGPWTFEIWNENDRSLLTFSLSDDQPWIQLSATAGTSGGPEDRFAVEVTVLRNQMKQAPVQGVITITSDGGDAYIDIAALDNGTAEGEGEGTAEGEGAAEGEGVAEGEGEGTPEGEEGADDLLFIHHSVGENWLLHSLENALLAESYIDERNDITYGTDVSPDAGRLDTLEPVPGDLTDMHHWILWFNDYLGRLKTFGCADGVNRIIMFKSCFPNSHLDDDGAEPGNPFDDWKTLANYRAVYRHPEGSGSTYEHNGRAYRALEDVFAANPNTLFIPVTAPPECWVDTDTDISRRARTFNNWLKNTWLPGYVAATGLHNVAVFDLFDVLAIADAAGSHPNQLRSEYGGNTSDSHPNDAGNAQATYQFVTRTASFLDTAWATFLASAGGEGEGVAEGEGVEEGEGSAEGEGVAEGEGSAEGEGEGIAEGEGAAEGEGEGQGEGQVYYVNKGHAQSNDANPGTINLPWKTLAHAAEAATAGDTVYIQGIYNEQFMPQNSGAPGAYITFSAYAKSTAVIDGTGVTTGNNGILIETDYIRLHDLEVRNWNSNGIWVRNAAFTQMSDCEVHDVLFGIGFTDGAHDFTLDRVEMHDFDYYGFDATPDGAPCYNGTLNDCVSHSGRDPGANVDGFALGHGEQQNFTLNRCVTYEVYDGFDISSQHTTLNGCLAHHCWNGGYKLWQDNVNLVNCIGYSCTVAVVELDWDNEPGTSTLRNCTFVDGGTFTIAIENPGDTLRMYNCIIAGGDNIGLLFGEHSSANYQGDYNLFHNDNAARAVVVGYQDEFSVEDVGSGAWTTYSGQDAHSVTAPSTAALFVDPANYDLHLAPGSPAVDTGTAASAPADDFDGNERPQGSGHDIGAYEQTP